MRRNNKNYRCVFRATVAVGAITALDFCSYTLALAAEPPTDVKEVIVTANKRNERIQDVASAVSAVSGADLVQTQTLDLQDLGYRVPGLNLVQSGLTTKIVVRGLNSGGDGATVATVIDDVPLSFSGANTDGGFLATDLDTYDLRDVEVLRGPQGTLYGATAEGGLIKYETNKPNYSRYQAGLEAGTWSVAHGQEGYSGKGYINIPFLNNTAALRVIGFSEELPGFVSNNFLHQSDVNSGRRYGGRVELAWRPLQDLTIRGTVSLQTHNESGSDGIAVNGIQNGTPATQFGLVQGYNQNFYTNGVSRNRIALYALHVDYDLHWARLSSITSYGLVNTFTRTDAPADAAILAYYTGAPANATIYNTHNVNKANQELRLASEPGNQFWGHALDWQVGFYATRERVAFHQDYEGTTFPGGVTLPSIFGHLGYDFLPSFYEEQALYADGTYHFTPKFDVEVGGRIASSTEGSTATQDGVLLFGFPGPNTLPSIRKTETVGNFSFAPRYHFTSDIMGYLRIASGYRPGGPQIPILGEPAGVPTTFHSDSTISYEVGSKGEFFDKTFMADVALFRVDWSNIQITQIVTVNGLQYGITGNGGTATSQGAEWNFSWRPLHSLSLGFLGAYTDAKLTADAPGAGGLRGQALAYVPDVSGSLTANYEVPAFADYNAFVGGAINYVGKRYSDFSPTAAISHLALPSYENYEARFGLKNSTYGIEIYGKNLSDARGITSYSAYGGFGGFGSINLIRPRTVGVRVSADF